MKIFRPGVNTEHQKENSVISLGFQAEADTKQFDILVNAQV